MTTAAKSLTVHLVLEQLRYEGVRHIFSSTNSCDSPITASLLAQRNRDKDDLSVSMAFSELNAVFMGSGYAQATSMPAVINLAAGQGLLNALPAIYAANRSQVPLVVLADQEDSHIFNEDPPLAVEHLSTVQNHCKWVAEARTAREICRLMRRAFHEALTPPKGPVVLSIPINLLLSSAKANSLRPPLTSPLGPADENFISKVVSYIVKARNPCMIVGNEVAQYRARKDAVLLSEVIGCPVYSEPLPTGVNFPNRHPHFGGVLPLELTESNDRLKDHDLLILLGVQTRLPNRTEGTSLVPDQALVVQINMDGHLAGKSLRSSMATQADISETLSRLRAEIQLAVDNEWLQQAKIRARHTIAQIADRRHQLEESLTYPNPTKPTTLFWLMRLLDGVRPQKSVIVSDIVHQTSPSDVLALESGSAFFSSNSGVSGYAVGAALGVQWATREIPVVCLTGDDTFLACPQGVWTAAHYEMNTKFIIANTRGKSRLNLLPSAPTRRPPRWELVRPEFGIDLMAKSMGCPAVRVDQFSDLEPALTKLFAEPGPMLIDVAIDLDS